MLSTVWNTQGVLRSYIEKRRGRRVREVTRRRKGGVKRGDTMREVTRRRKGGVKRGDTNLSSNQFPEYSPQPGTPR